MAQQVLRARYKTVGPKKELVRWNKCSHDPELGLVIEPVEEEKLCWRVYFPQGHSIRITDEKELKRLGYNIKPRLVDMATGEVVDYGGDPYDFTQQQEDPDLVLLPNEDEDEEGDVITSTRKK